MILLFEVGLESDLGGLLRAGPQATVVALVGVVAPFAVGYGVMAWLGHPALLAVFVGATLTATSVASRRACCATWVASRTPPPRWCSGRRSWTTSWA